MQGKTNLSELGWSAVENANKILMEREEKPTGISENGGMFLPTIC